MQVNGRTGEEVSFSLEFDSILTDPLWEKMKV